MNNWIALPKSPDWKQLEKAALTLICALALLSSPSVVCLVQSGPSGIRTFKRSRHRRRWARLQGEKRTIRAVLSERECHFLFYFPPTRQFSCLPLSTHHKIPHRYQDRLPLNYLHCKHQLLTNTCIIANLWQALFIFLLSELIIWLIWMNFAQGQGTQADGTSILWVSSLSQLFAVLRRRTFVKVILNDCYPLHTCALLVQRHLLWTDLGTIFLHKIKNNEKNGQPKIPKQSLLAAKGARGMIVPKNCSLTPSWAQVWNAAGHARSVGTREPKTFPWAAFWPWLMSTKTGSSMTVLLMIWTIFCRIWKHVLGKMVQAAVAKHIVLRLHKKTVLAVFSSVSRMQEWTADLWKTVKYGLPFSPPSLFPRH